MEKYEYLYVLDYSTPSIIEIKLTESDADLSTEEILDKYELNDDECAFMYSTKKLELETIN